MNKVIVAQNCPRCDTEQHRVERMKKGIRTVDGVER